MMKQAATLARCELTFSLGGRRSHVLWTSVSVTACYPLKPLSLGQSSK